ncbi:MAG: beta-ketoacyl-[acyl-carrier-protein] synthase family protein [Planctomycetota bacterium]
MGPRGREPGARRAVITGIGAVSAAGYGVEPLFNTLLDGRSCIGPIRDFDTSPYPAKKAARVPSGVEDDPGGRSLEFLIRAAEEALTSGGVDREAFQGPGTAVVMGTTLGGMDRLADLLDRPEDPRVAAALPYHAGADRLADRFGAGDASTLSGACASSLMSVGWAARLVRAGRFRSVLAGGYDPFCEFVHAGFSSLLALDGDTLRPFDRDRKGLVIGEGAGVVLVEERGKVLAEGRTPRAEILGAASLGDANHITGPHPEGDGLLRTLEEAWKESGLPLSAVDAIHAHGTGTLYNDRMEGIALRRFLGTRWGEVPVTASKGVIGHTLGAAGALETVIVVEMLREGVLPPTVNFRTLDPEVGIDPVRETTPRTLGVVVKTSAGFGGQNAVLVLGKAAP